MKTITSNVGIKTGLFFVAIDFGFWLIGKFIGNGSMSWLVSLKNEQLIMLKLSEIWNFIHSTVNFLFLPYIIEHIPSHREGVEVILYDNLYWFLCFIEIFIIGFIFGVLIAKIKELITGVTRLPL